MSTQHPITPPPEMVASLRNSVPHWFPLVDRETWLIKHAYAAGADMELEACCEWLSFYSAVSDARDLRAARRPKPPSLKAQGLEALGPSPGKDHAVMIDHAGHQAILAALEALPNA